MDNLRFFFSLMFRRTTSLLLTSFLLSACFGEWHNEEKNMLGEYPFKLGAHVKVPKDYCIDQQLLIDKSKSSFLVMLPCNEVVASEKPSLITITLARADMEQNRPTLELVEDYLVRKSAEVFHQAQFTSFVRPSKTQSVELHAMQKKPWQAVSIMSQHLVVVTLYIPDYVQIDQKVAINRLSSVLERITFPQSDGNTPVLMVSPEPKMLRPMMRPQKL